MGAGMKMIQVLCALLLVSSLPARSISCADGAQRFQVTELTLLDGGTGLLWSRDGNLSGVPLPWAEAKTFVAGLNDKGFAGRKDWRLPSRDELAALASSAKAAGFDGSEESRQLSVYFNQLGCAGVQPASYWTGTVSPALANNVWFVNFWDGDLFYDYDHNPKLVWPVSGGGP